VAGDSSEGVDSMLSPAPADASATMRSAMRPPRRSRKRIRCGSSGGAAAAIGIGALCRAARPRRPWGLGPRSRAVIECSHPITERSQGIDQETREEFRG